ncbi:MAG: sigmaY antisigma factor component [Firmicutes bacterium]|nr:sigmaY antisigma factor component [Bacillota bacterium]
MEKLVWLAYPLIAVLLLTQALWIFHDARKRGENAWLWGLLGLLNVPSSLIVYLLVTRRKKIIPIKPVLLVASQTTEL